MSERCEQPRDDQASRLADCLYYKKPQVAPTRDHPQAGTSDTGSLHTAWADTHKANCREDAQPTAHRPRHIMNQKMDTGCECDEAVICKAVLHYLNALHRASPAVTDFRTLLTAWKTTHQV